MNHPDSSLKVLIVEDEAIVALELEDRFLALGWQSVGITPRGEEAIRLAGVKKPNLVIMDVNLKGEVNGIEAAEAIYRQHSIPSLYITASPLAEVKRRMTAPYFFPVLIKPFDDGIFLKAVTQALHFSPQPGSSSSFSREED